MTAQQSSPDSSSRRLKIIVGIGMGLGVLLFLGGRLMSGGEDTGTDASFDTGRLTPTPTTVAAAPAAPAAPGAEPAETFEVFTTKNPFLPLRGATAASAGAPAAPPAPAPASAAPVVASAPVATVAAPTAAPPAPAPASAPVGSTAAGAQAAEPSRATTRVALLDVFTDGDRILANVRVNDTMSRVGAGDTFATNFKVVSLDPGDRCGRFLFGDDQFRLCKGEEVLK